MSHGMNLIRNNKYICWSCLSEYFDTSTSFLPQGGNISHDGELTCITAEPMKFIAIEM